MVIETPSQTSKNKKRKKDRKKAEQGAEQAQAEEYPSLGQSSSKKEQSSFGGVDWGDMEVQMSKKELAEQKRAMEEYERANFKYKQSKDDFPQLGSGPQHQIPVEQSNIVQSKEEVIVQNHKGGKKNRKGKGGASQMTLQNFNFQNNQKLMNTGVSYSNAGLFK